MVGTEVMSAALHAVVSEPDSGSHLDHAENASSGSNDDINGDSTHYDSGDNGSALVSLHFHLLV